VRTRQSLYPFMVFAEAVPQAARLADAKTTPDERAMILREVRDTIDIVKSVVDRNTQSGRHKKNHERRDRIMAKLRRDEHGAPVRGETKRLARRYGVSTRTVEKWIAQLRRAPARGSEAVPDDWRTVYVGEGLRHQYRVAAHRRRKNRV
jgi:hypothetical protein